MHLDELQECFGNNDAIARNMDDLDVLQMKMDDLDNFSMGTFGDLGDFISIPTLDQA